MSPVLDCALAAALVPSALLPPAACGGLARLAPPVNRHTIKPTSTIFRIIPRIVLSARSGYDVRLST